MKLAVAALALLPALHDVHVSTARMAIDGRTAVVRVTMFKNDLQTAIRSQAKQPSFILDATPRADSLVLDYLRQHVQLSGGFGPARLLGSGEEAGVKRDLDVWYYDLRFDSAKPIRHLRLTNDVMFELFHDQRNIVKVRLPNGKEKTVFFVPDETSYELKW